MVVVVDVDVVCFCFQFGCVAWLLLQPLLCLKVLHCVFSPLFQTHMLGLALRRHPIWYYPEIVILHSSLRFYAVFFSSIRIRLARRLNYDFQCDSLFPRVCAFHCWDIVPQTASYAFVKFKLTWHCTSIEKCCVISDVLQTANRIELFELQIHLWTVYRCVSMTVCMRVFMWEKWTPSQVNEF